MVSVTNPRWDDPGETLVRVEIDGVDTLVPPMPSHPHYRAILDADLDIAPYAAPVPSPADLIAYAADKRWRVETGGVVVNGAQLWTDRTTQVMLSRTVQLLDKGMLTAPINVKTPGGFLPLSQQDIEGIGAAVAQHVQAAFDAELLVLAGIETETITSFADIDAAAWPPND